jgi:DNA invertase Pin-like site-specific DNA recombinase
MERPMARNPSKAVAYYRTSSAANVGEDKDSLARQRAAVTSYAKGHGVEVVDEFYDAAVSGADAIDARPGFADLLERILGNGVRTVLVEDASRFARDLIVQLTGHERLRALGVELVPVNAPDHFKDDTPTARMVRQILGAVAEFEKAQLVARLRAARERKRAATGRCEGASPVPAEVVAAARRLARKSPKTGQRRSLRAISAELATLGHVARSGKPYGAESVRRMLAR